MADYKSRLLEDIESEDVVIDALDFIFQKFDAEISVNFIKTIEIPVVTDIALQKMYKLISWATLQHDGTQLNPSLPLEKLSPDEEMAPASIDPWARGTGNNINKKR